MGRWKALGKPGAFYFKEDYERLFDRLSFDDQQLVMARFPFPLEILGIIAGFALVAMMRAPYKGEEGRNLRLVPPPPNIERFSLGYNDTIADTLWVRVLQDLDTCESVKGGVAHVEGVQRDVPACRQGWVYHMINSITNLAPNWALPYRTGSLILSIAVDDIEGATLIFEKGLAKFPYDYNLLYNASYHYIWEVKEPKRAAALLITAAQHGGPPWFYALAGKLYTEAGQAELAKGVLENALKDTPEGAKGRDRIEKRLDEVNKKLQAEANKKSN